MGRAWVSDSSVSYSRTVIDSIDGMTNPVDGAEAEIVQLGAGRIAGRLTRATIGDVSFSKGSFSLPIRASGVLSQSRLTIGVLLRCSSPLKARLGIGVAGDIFINPPGFDHYCVFTSAASFAALCIDTIDLAMTFRGEGPLSDPAFWSRPFHCRPANPGTAAQIERHLRQTFARLATKKPLSAASADYLTRGVVEVIAAPVIDATVTLESSTIACAIRIVREAEHYVDARSFRPVHISELCSHLKVSRRTLHRCFEDVLGIGPGAFLRQKRLCFAHSALRRLDGRAANVTQVATEFGFLELGRFAHQYRQLFGEYPNETLRR
jgi:AraC-like DNA-binding protein